MSYVEMSNGADEGAQSTSVNGTAKAQLLSIVERIERLEEEKAALATDVREVYLEAKAEGFDVKALRAIISMRKKSENERAEQEAVLHTYMAALGMVVDLPED